MNQETLKSIGEMRRKAWLLDSPARRTGSDGDGRLRQEAVSVSPWWPALPLGLIVLWVGEKSMASWGGGVAGPPVRCLARAPAGAGGSERWGLCWLRSREAWGRVSVRDPRRKSRCHSLWRSPLGSRDACARLRWWMWVGPRGRGFGGRPTNVKWPNYPLRKEILLVEEMWGNGRKFQAP
jgi:hypothetical protein